MSQSPENQQETNILGKFASVLGILGVILFFAGWIYRWSYFSFFQLEVTTLDLPTESFFFVPIQIFLGNPRAILTTILAIIVTIIFIQVSLWLIRILSEKLSAYLRLLLRKIIEKRTPKRKSPWLLRQLKSLAFFLTLQLKSKNILRSLINEIVIISWTLIFIFAIARWNGNLDARRDAGVNSPLPVVTLITPENQIALGRKLDDEFINPSLKGYKFIGDKGLFEDIRGKEDTDINQQNPNPRVWRLLLERNGWVYIFSTLPANARSEQRPLVLAVQITDQGNLIIRSPEASRPKSP